MCGWAGGPPNIWSWRWWGRICWMTGIPSLVRRSSTRGRRKSNAGFMGRSPCGSNFNSLVAGACLATALLAGQALPAQEAPPSEYQLKAAFLYNFAKFVEWPPQAFPDATTPVTIGIIGESPFDDDLERTVKNKNVNGPP